MRSETGRKKYKLPSQFCKNDTFCTFQLWFQIAVICKFVIFYIDNLLEEIFYIGLDNHTIYWDFKNIEIWK